MNSAWRSENCFAQSWYFASSATFWASDSAANAFPTSAAS